YEVMDLCLSCKGCKSECPSNVDVAKLKAEFLQHYYDANGVPIRSRLIGSYSSLSRIGSWLPKLYNYLMTGKGISRLIKKFSGFAAARSLPSLPKETLKKWFKKHQSQISGNPGKVGTVYFFCDEFTNYHDATIGIKSVLLLERLGYEVIIPDHEESGRTWLSKGLLRKAKKIANRNLKSLGPLISAERPLIGIEPSAILCFRDEYIDLADDDLLESAKALSKNVFSIEEFLSKEIDRGMIRKEQFSNESKKIKLHGHCQQKALSSLSHAVKVLSLPENYVVETIPSGCCGMAGSFGYEKEHYELAMKIGELVLFPSVRNQPEEILIAASGTSCRHQILDGTGKKAQHPAQILFDALV
ncbi:MAG: (Fe-S)-binding protein, partial [Chitinophagales bacterium]